MVGVKGGRVGNKDVIGTHLSNHDIEPRMYFVGPGVAYVSQRQAKFIMQHVSLVKHDPFDGLYGGVQICVSSALDWPKKKMKSYTRSRISSENPRRRKHGRQTRTPR